MIEEPKLPIITKPIIILSLVSLFTDVASEMLYPIMPLYLRSIGFSVLLIGILEGIAEATAGISKGYFGQLSDRLSVRIPFIRLGYGLSAFAKPLLAVSSNAIWVFLIRTSERLGKGLRTSARDAFLSDQTVPEHKAMVFGFHRGMDTLGAAIGPIIAIIILYFLPSSYRILFAISFIPGFVALALTYRISERRLEPILTGEKVKFFGFLGYWKKATTNYKYLVIGLLLFTLINSSDIFLLLALKEKGYTDIQMIWFYVFYNFVYALFSFPIGKLADKIGLRLTLIIGIFLFAVVYYNYGNVTGTIYIGVLFLIYGLYASATEGVSKALISNISNKNETATAIGFYNSFQSICTLIASSVGGFIWFTFSSKTMFVFSGIGALVVLIYFAIVFSLQRK